MDLISYLQFPLQLCLIVLTEYVCNTSGKNCSQEFSQTQNKSILPGLSAAHFCYFCNPLFLLFLLWFQFPPSFALPPCRHTRRYTGLCPLSQTAFLKDASCLQIKIGISVTKGSTEQVTPSTELSSLHFLYSLSFFYCFYSSDEFLCA